MPILEKYLADFEEKGTFHVYNRTNNKEKLFLNDENKFFFLKKYRQIVSPFTDTICWSLLANHFHLLIQIKAEADIVFFLQSKPKNELTITERKFLEKKIAISELIEQTFKRFFQSYALSFNKAHNRKGNLFHRPFKRIKIETDAQFTMAIIYIHANAMKHGQVKDFTKYQWSSWQTLISNQSTSLAREKIIEWFGTLEICIRTHMEMTIYYYDCEVAIED